MNEYNKSNYAINKFSRGIVYKNADGSILEVTFEKIAKGNPEFTQEDFENLKQLSDEMYHEEAKGDWNYHYHIAGCLDEYRFIKQLSSLSPEDELDVRDNEAAFNENFCKAVDALLTPIQKRRLYLNCFEGATVREIAETEGVSYSIVARSIKAGKEKLKKFLKNF